MAKQREQGSAERYFRTGRFMTFDGIKLVPAASDFYPFNTEHYADKWHVHGRKSLMSTAALVKLATQRSLSVTITEYEGVTTQTTRLN